MSKPKQELPEGFTAVPETLAIGEREKRLLERLWRWGQESEKTHWILGEPQ